MYNIKIEVLTLILFRPLITDFILSCPVLSCPFFFFTSLSWHFLSFPVFSCPVLSCPVLYCPVLSCPILSLVLSCHFLSCPVVVILQTLNEILGRGVRSDTVPQINVNDHVSSDNLTIANHFNNSFTNIGKEIANSVPPVSKKPEDFIDYGREIPNMQLGNTTVEHIIKTIKKFHPKNSCDIDGVSTKMIKFISAEIATPLSHIFNLSLHRLISF
jgi:hypothetical protein